MAHRKKRRSNSTSSLFIQTTLTTLNLDEICMSVSTMLHCQMVRDEAGGLVQHQDKFPFFKEATYTGRLKKRIPDAEKIYVFLREMFAVGEFPSECAVILLVYINRLIGIVQMPLTCNNWRPILTIALLLAQKVWDDNPLANADFNILYPVLNIKQINLLELQFLLLLQYKLNVTPSLYARYFFELRTICENEWKNPLPKLLTVKQSYAHFGLKPPIKRLPKRVTIEDLEYSKKSTAFILS